MKKIELLIVSISAIITMSSWNCYTCSFINADVMETCEMCESKKGTTWWICVDCKFDRNPPSTQYCETCWRARIEGIPLVETWSCCNCKASNDMRVQVCKACSALKGLIFWSCRDCGNTNSHRTSTCTGVGCRKPRCFPGSTFCSMEKF
jgi:hypothetical protein